MVVKWLKRIFKGEEARSWSQQDGLDVFGKKINFSDKELGVLSERVKSIDGKLHKLQKMLEELYKQQERMDDLAQKIIEVVAHECTLDTKVKELEKKVQAIEGIVGTPQEERKNEKQTIFEL